MNGVQKAKAVWLVMDGSEPGWLTTCLPIRRDEYPEGG